MAPYITLSRINKISFFPIWSQPYLTLQGHIHESSEISSTYWDLIGETICINPGQSAEEFYGVVFDLEDITGTIEHTVFGPMA
jgi:Icc-related predicted phosphoesterase